MEYYKVEFTDNSTDRLIKNNKKKLRVEKIEKFQCHLNISDKKNIKELSH